MWLSAPPISRRHGPLSHALLAENSTDTIYAKLKMRTVLGQTSIAWSLGTLVLFTVALPLHGQSDQGYVGAEACAKCHAGINHEWAESRHSKMMQPATKQSVKGDFSQGKVILRGWTYLLKQSNDKYYITESYLTGKSWEHRVKYTLGDRRFQHYLTTLPDGRIILIPPTWGVIRRRWDHDLDIGNPEEAPEDPIQSGTRPATLAT
jgi:hypothetical protein